MAFGDIAVGSRGSGGRSHTAPSVTVPLQFDGDFPVISVTINGHKLPMAIDLVQIAPLSLLQSSIDEVKPEIVVDNHEPSDGSAGGAAPRIKIQHLEIGGMMFSNVDGYIDMRAPATHTSNTPQGIIGLALLRSFKVILDYKHKSITFIRNSRSASESDNCTGTTVRFIPEWHGAPVARAHTDFGDLVLVWDTGAAHGVIRKKAADDLHVSVSNQTVSLPHLNFGDADLGAMDFRVVDYAQLPGTDGFIGNDFFANHVVCIDFPGTRFLVRR
jgi:hypothetical protein